MTATRRAATGRAAIGTTAIGMTETVWGNAPETDRIAILVDTLVKGIAAGTVAGTTEEATEESMKSVGTGNVLSATVASIAAASIASIAYLATARTARGGGIGVEAVTVAQVRAAEWRDEDPVKTWMALHVVDETGVPWGTAATVGSNDRPAPSDLR